MVVVGENIERHDLEIQFFNLGLARPDRKHRIDVGPAGCSHGNCADRRNDGR